jgi:hypothetical protein
MATIPRIEMIAMIMNDRRARRVPANIAPVERGPWRNARPLLQNAAVALALAACSTLSDVARDQFATDYRCKRQRARELAPETYEVAGCGRHIIYRCTRMISNDAVLIPPTCRAK